MNLSSIGPKHGRVVLFASPSGPYPFLQFQSKKNRYQFASFDCQVRGNKPSRWVIHVELARRALGESAYGLSVSSDGYLDSQSVKPTLHLTSGSVRAATHDGNPNSSIKWV